MERNFESVGLPPDLPGVEYHSCQHYILFKSRESKYKELLDALSDDTNYVTGLQGMGGTGKTTLANQVGKQLKQCMRFDFVIDTTVSNTPDIKKIQDDIAGPLGLSLKDYNESQRPKVLWTRLTNGDKILVILDDVWGYIKFEEIGIPYSGDHKGCRVLLTTRNQSVCISLGCERTVQLELLSEEDAWVLFKKHAGIKDGFPMGLLEKGRKIVKECKGLPVAIAAIASSLKGQKHKDDWDAALKSLKTSVSISGVDENMIDVYKCLCHSYNNLKSEQANKLFLLSSLFPEDTEIPIQILTRLGIAVGIFGELDGNYYEARGQVVRAKNKLIDSCLMLTAREGGMENFDLVHKEEALWIDGRVKMHDLVREVALWVANKKIRAVNLANKNHKSMVERENDIEYLLCEGNGKNVFSYKVNGSNLKLLVVNDIHADEDGDNTLIIPISFFENMTSLRALFLSCDSRKKMMALSLPQSTRSLTNIRSVYLKSLELGDISILGNLRSLETLELLWCSIDELPGAISELSKFRLLTLHFCQIRRNNPFEVIKRCSSLEELYLYIGESDFQVDNITLPALQRYHISQKDFWDENYSQLKCACFSEIDGFFSQSTFKYLMKTAEVLWLTGIKGAWANLIPEIIPSISDSILLHLKSCSQIQCLIDCTTTRPDYSNILPKLVVLKLEGMEKLNALCSGRPIPFQLLKSLESLEIRTCIQLQGMLFKSELYLCNLKTLTLYNCPKLISLFQLSTSQRLVLLEKLIVEDCEQLKSIITDEGQGEESEEEIVDADNDNKNHGSMFPSLRTLYISNCPRLESVLPFISAQGFPLLEAITVWRCDELKYIFGQYQIELKDQDLHKEENDLLSSLTRLDLDKVPNFIDIFPDFCRRLCSSGKSLSSSKAEAQPESTRSNIFPWNLMCCYAHKYRSTTSTKIPPVFSDQPEDSSISSLRERAKSLPKQFQVLQTINLLQNIKEIVLRHIKVEFVFVLSIAPTMLLESLQVMFCDELKCVIVDTGNEQDENRKLGAVFPKLKELRVAYCENLEYIFGHHFPHNPQVHNEIEIHLPALEYVEIHALPNLIGICPKSYCTTLPPSLTRFILLIGCPRVTIKHIGEFFMTHLNSTVKDMSENVMMNSKVKNILYLKDLQLGGLSVMTSLFLGPKYSTSLENLRLLSIWGCEKLQVVLSTCVVRCLPHLHSLWIAECRELKQIFEDDDVGINERTLKSFTAKTKTRFPKLKVITVKGCNMLKCVLPTSKEVPNLECLIIEESSELERVFQCEQVELPNLKAAVLIKLPMLCGGIDLQTPKHVFMLQCPNLPSSSAIPLNRWRQIIEDEQDSWPWYELRHTIDRLVASDLEDTKDENSTTKTVEDVPDESDNGEGQVPISSFSVVTAEHHTDKDLAAYGVSQEIHGSVFVHNHTCAPEYERDGFSKSLFEDAVRELADEHNKSKAQDVNIDASHCHETSKSAVAIAETYASVSSNVDASMKASLTFKSSPSIHSPNAVPFEGEHSELIGVPCLRGQDIPLHKTHSHDELLDEQSIGEPCLAKKQQPLEETNITFEIPTSREVDVIHSQETLSFAVSSAETLAPGSKSFPIIQSHVASQTPSIPSKGNNSQTVEDLSFASLVTRELEQLVSSKHLAYENLLLLTDFLVKHPSVCLIDNALSNKYKGYAYSCLVELLKFLQTHSALDVLGSSHTEFVELLQDVRCFAFDKDWLDDVERRALHPCLQVSQDALQKVLESKQQATKEVEELNLKILIFTQHVEDLKHQLASSKAALENIIQDEAQILEAWATLSAPLGY